MADAEVFVKRDKEIAMNPFCKVLSAYALLLLLVGSTTLSGCAKSGTTSGSPSSGADSVQTDEAYSLAIRAVLNQDSEYGRVRNQATKTHTIADAIRGYIADLDRIDFSECPDTFTYAFKQHRDAWEAALPFFGQFAGLRGEMHELFEAIRDRDAETHTALEQVEEPIWSTWATVDSIATQYAPPDGLPDMTSTCLLSEEDSHFIQQALDGWERISRETLHLDPKPLPWMVLFNASCIWHLAAQEEMLLQTQPMATSLMFGGDPVPVYVQEHTGTVRLPNDQEIPADIIAFAAPYNGGKDAFFALALMELWEASPVLQEPDPHFETRLLGVVLHEVLHTRQLPDVSRQVARLRKHYDLPDQFDDDIVENTFRPDPAYREAFEAERDLFYEAAAESNSLVRDSLVTMALDKARQRRARFFSGLNEYYAALEIIFLNIEGASEWARFKFHQTDSRWPNEDSNIISFIRGTDNNWVQDEGLALFLLIDSMVPNWQKLSPLGPELASPFQLLEGAMRPESEEH